MPECGAAPDQPQPRPGSSSFRRRLAEADGLLRVMQHRVNSANGASLPRSSPVCYFAAMSAVELAIEKVQRLDETHARQLLAWLQAQEQDAQICAAPLGARAMLGFARRFRAQPRSTADWMAELREGEQT